MVYTKTACHDSTCGATLVQVEPLQLWRRQGSGRGFIGTIGLLGDSRMPTAMRAPRPCRFGQLLTVAASNCLPPSCHSRRTVDWQVGRTSL